MIEINLLPLELRTRAKAKKAEAAAVSTSAAGKSKIDPQKIFFYAIPAIIGVLVFLHLYLAILTIVRNGEMIYLNKKWISLQPDKISFEQFNNEYSSLSQDASVLQKFAKQRVLWAPKLNKLSLHLPSGVWFNELLMDGRSLNIQGGVVSLQKEEVSLLNKFMDNLKDDNVFSADFLNQEISFVQKKNLGGYDVASFIISGVLKNNELKRQ
jgi:hypothetical protein